MFRRLSAIFALTLVSTVFFAGAASAQYTTRIEPRPFYGAIVTLEEGVRVIRPLPPERHVIINPGNAPVSLGFNETRVYENRVVRHQYEGGRGGDGEARSGGLSYGYIGSPYGLGARGYGYGRVKGGAGYGPGIRHAPLHGAH